MLREEEGVAWLSSQGRGLMAETPLVQTYCVKRGVWGTELT